MKVKNIRVRPVRGTTLANAGYTGPSGSLSVDTQRNMLRIHDGITQGGHPLQVESTEDHSSVKTFADLSKFPAVGLVGVLYIAADTDTAYRWTEGNAYLEVSAKPKSTDQLKEGEANKFFTDERARNAFKAGNGIEIKDGTISSTGTGSASIPVATDAEVSEGARDDVFITPKQLHQFMKSAGFSRRDNGVWDFGTANKEVKS